jgi:hypothetical protein
VRPASLGTHLDVAAPRQCQLHQYLLIPHLIIHLDAVDAGGDLREGGGGGSMSNSPEGWVVGWWEGGEGGRHTAYSVCSNDAEGGSKDHGRGVMWEHTP